MSIVRKSSKNSNFLPPFPQPEIEKIYSSMVCTDTKLHAEVIKLLFWNFHWGHDVSVSLLACVQPVLSIHFFHYNCKIFLSDNRNIFYHLSEKLFCDLNLLAYMGKGTISLSGCCVHLSE